MKRNLKIPARMKVFNKGQVVIPSALRKKYHIEIGDHINIIPTDEGILLQNSKENDKGSLTDKLFGIFSSYAGNQKNPSKKDINAAAEEGFAEGWKE